MFLCGAFVLAIVEFFVLLAIILNCSKVKRESQRISHQIKLFSEERSVHSFPRSSPRENIYQEEYHLSIGAPDIREIFVQPTTSELKTPPTKFKGQNNYRLTGNSYLI